MVPLQWQDIAGGTILTGLEGTASEPLCSFAWWPLQWRAMKCLLLFKFLRDRETPISSPEVVLSEVILKPPQLVYGRWVLDNCIHWWYTSPCCFSNWRVYVCAQTYLCFNKLGSVTSNRNKHNRGNDFMTNNSFQLITQVIYFRNSEPCLLYCTTPLECVS